MHGLIRNISINMDNQTPLSFHLDTKSPTVDDFVSPRSTQRRITTTTNDTISTARHRSDEDNPSSFSRSITPDLTQNRGSMASPSPPVGHRNTFKSPHNGHRKLSAGLINSPMTLSRPLQTPFPEQALHEDGIFYLFNEFS